MTDRLRTIAGLAVLLFTVDLAALPCGTACHQSRVTEPDAETTGSTAEHSCHEAPVAEDLPQVAAIPASCTHQHDVADSPRISASIDRDQHSVSTPAVLLPSSLAGIVRLHANPSPPPRPASLNAASFSFSLRI